MNNAVAILKKNTMLIVLILVFILFTVLTGGNMFMPYQFNSLVDQNAYVFILASGMLMCMLTGGNIDLSVGSFVCFVGSVSAYFMVCKGYPVPVTILIALAIGIAYGCLLGFLIAYVHIPPWIATLAGFLAFRGLGTQVITSNSSTGSIAPTPDGFNNLFSGVIMETPRFQINILCLVVGIAVAVVFVLLQLKDRKSRLSKGYEVESLTYTIVKIVCSVAAILLFTIMLSLAGGIPVTLVWVAVIVLIYNFITSKTTLGRYFYTTGGNAEATRLSGIDTKKIMFIAYLNMAVLTTITSWIVLARSRTAFSTAGNNYEMDAISACVVGGVSAYGGSGTIFGMVVGATLIGVINLGLSLTGVSEEWIRVVKGLVLLGAVVFDILNNKGKNEK